MKTVNVPEAFEPIFNKAQDYVEKYFKEKVIDPTKGTIKIFGERYILIRAASFSTDFFDTVKELYQDKGETEARAIARQLLFDIAHSAGKHDAKNFHAKMGVVDPIEKLSIGPIHFSYTGWAFVDILPESKPTPDEDYYLIYDHPFSFEADTWIKKQKPTNTPVCIMNSGYSSGWCEESFGVTLVATEIMCKAKGDDNCRFIMSPPSRIEEHINNYLQKSDKLPEKIKYDIPTFFKSKQIEEERAEHLEELEKRNKLMVDRELKMVEMKVKMVEMGKKIKQLKTQIEETRDGRGEDLR